MRRRILSLAFGLAAACGALTCATTPVRIDDADLATLPSTALKTAVNWETAGDTAFGDLVRYLQTDTVNPPGNEMNGALFLADLLKARGIESELVDHGNNRASLIARVKATKPSGEGALCLVSHIDVVTSEPDRWPSGRGPLSGTVVDEEGETFVYGRGAIDMKGMGMMELHAIFALLDAKVPLTRDIVFLAVADEEVNSLGITTVTNDTWWPKVNCSHAINEGGLGLKDAILPGQTVFAISVGERGVLWTKVIAEGPPGHGSTPIPGRAPGKLLEVMKRFDAWEDTPTIHPALYELLASVGDEAGGINGFVMQRPFLVDMLVLDRLQKAPTTKAITNDTVHLTGFGGANAPNVVPSTVFAQYDVRLLPGTTTTAMKAELQALVDGIDDVKLEILEAKEANVSEWHDPLFYALQRHSVGDMKRAVAGPIISPGFTDSIVLRKRGVRAYGIIPIVVDAKDSATMHGDGERLSKANMVRGTRTLALTIADFAGQ